MMKNFSLSIAIKLQIKKINSQQTICEICVMFDMPIKKSRIVRHFPLIFTHTPYKCLFHDHRHRRTLCIECKYTRTIMDNHVYP